VAEFDAGAFLGDYIQRGPAAVVKAITAPTEDDRKIEDVPGFGYRASYTNENGVRVMRKLNENELRHLGITQAGDDARVEKAKEGKLRSEVKAEQAEKQNILIERDNRDYELRIKSLEEQNEVNRASIGAQLEQIRSSSAQGLEQLKLQGKRDENTQTLGMAQLGQQGEQHKDAMAVRNDELRMSREQMQLNNQLQGRKLDMEDRHFQQQAALDHKNSRRTQVMNALTLIAQSAAKL
jgi:hypothetical protein